MKRRKYLLRGVGMCLCAALVICSSRLIYPSGALGEAPFDARAAMGQETVKLLEGASKDAYVKRDLATGEVTVTEPDPGAAKNVKMISPSIPDGLESVDPQKPGTKAIIGDDGRVQAPSVDVFPFSAVVQLKIEFQDGTTSAGTGAFVGDNLILTAGHIVYDPSIGWVTSVTAYPGGTSSSFGSTTAVSVASFNGWVSDYEFYYEYGLIEVADCLQAGSFGLSDITDDSLRDSVLTHYGFPGDKDEGTLWHSAGVAVDYYPDWFEHDMDAAGGQSGGPIVQQTAPTFITGVHLGQLTNDSNFAARINKKVIAFITSYIS